MIKANADDNRTSIEMEGSFATLMSDLTHIIHAMMGGLADNCGDDKKKADERIDMFRKMFVQGVLSGIFLKTERKEMDELIINGKKILK